MEYQEYKSEEQREAVRNELKQYEQQHFNSTANAAKFQDLLAAHDAGNFKGWDQRILVQRVSEWKVQRDNERINARVNEMLIEGAKKRLAAFGDTEKGNADTAEG